MIKVYQKIVDPGKGDCMRAVICSLLEIEDIDSVPNFIEFGDKWWSTMYHFLEEHGYRLFGGGLINKNYSRLMSPTSTCFKPEKWHKPSILSLSNMKKEKGIDGLFWGSVLSPKYCTSANGYFNTHAVVVDQNLNIIHDPNKEYENIIEYPLARILKYNGIYNVTFIERIEN